MLNSESAQQALHSNIPHVKVFHRIEPLMKSHIVSLVWIGGVRESEVLYTHQRKFQSMYSSWSLVLHQQKPYKVMTASSLLPTGGLR